MHRTRFQAMLKHHQQEVRKKVLSAVFLRIVEETQCRSYEKNTHRIPNTRHFDMTR